MSRARELLFRAANAGLIGALGWLHRIFQSPTTYRIGPEGSAASFEGCWFTYRPSEFGCTGNVDYLPDAENATRRAIFERLEGSEVFYDIGAHGGIYTITLLKRFPKLRVFSFEPQPEDLLANLRLNELPVDDLHHVAVGYEAGVVRMTTRQRSSNHVSPRGSRSVRQIRLDDYVLENNIPPPHWIKIDIEGLELPALKGAEQLIRASNPIIICEINRLHNRFGTSVSDFLGWMDSIGYEGHRLTEGNLEKIASAENFAALGYSADWNFWFLPMAGKGNLTTA